MLKKSMVYGAVMTALFTSASALAETSVNAGATTDYLWRGVTQSADTASVFGGVDWADDSGVYAGVWLGSLVFETETDFYAGYAGEAGDFGYDVGVVSYMYTMAEPNINFTEAYLTGSYGAVSGGIYSTISTAEANEGGVFDKGDMYVNLAADFKTGAFDTSVFVGNYLFTNDSATNEVNYIHYGASFSFDEVTVSIEKNDIVGDEDTRIVATWSKAWDVK